MILCTFTGVLRGTRGDGVRRWWSATQGIALTGSQMRSERRSEGTRGNTRAGQKKRSETKYGCGGDGVAMVNQCPNYGRGMCGGVVALKTQSRFVFEFLFSVLNTRNRSTLSRTHSTQEMALTRTELTFERFLHSTGIIIRVHQKETLKNEI